MMSYPHRATAASPSLHRPIIGRGTPVEKRTLRTVALTRRYEISWVGQSGSIETATKLAPATAEFEEAFSAFARGTVIATADGPVAIEDLVPGVRVVTAEGRTETVVWIGSMTLYPPRAVPDKAPVAMTRITADALGLNRPMPDLVLGPRARILFRDPRCRMATGLDAAYAPAAALIDGECVIAVTPMAPIAVYHLVLSGHGSVRAAGIEIESYHPGAGFAEVIEPQLQGLFLSLFPQAKTFADFGPQAHQRLSADEFAALL
jgi:Hint domain